MEGYGSGRQLEDKYHVLIVSGFYRETDQCFPGG